MLLCRTTPFAPQHHKVPLKRHLHFPESSLHRLPTAPQENGERGRCNLNTGYWGTALNSLWHPRWQLPASTREDSAGPGAVPVLPTNRTVGHGAAQNTPHAGPRGERAVSVPLACVTCSLGEPGAGGKGRHGGSGLGQMLVTLVQWHQALGSARGFQNQARVRAGAPSRPQVGKGPWQVWRGPTEDWDSSQVGAGSEPRCGQTGVENQLGWP